MALRKVTFRLYPNAAQAERLMELLGLHQRVYNTALEERIRAYQAEGTSLNFATADETYIQVNGQWNW